VIQPKLLGGDEVKADSPQGSGRMNTKAVSRQQPHRFLFADNPSKISGYRRDLL
jgi:hypothetical protein